MLENRIRPDKLHFAEEKPTPFKTNGRNLEGPNRIPRTSGIEPVLHPIRRSIRIIVRTTVVQQANTRNLKLAVGIDIVPIDPQAVGAIG